MPDDQVLKGLSDAFHMRCRWDLVLMGLIVEVDRRRLYRPVDESVEPWLCRFLGIGYFAACVMVSIAKMLDRAPPIREAYGQGRISYDHLRALVQVTGPDNAADMLKAVEGRSVADAFRLVRKVVSISAEDSDELTRQRWLQMRIDRETRALLIEGKLPEDAGAKVRLAIDSLARTMPDDPDLDTTPMGVKRADALEAMASSSLSEHPSKPTVVVHVAQDELSKSSGAGRLDADVAVSPATVRRMICQGSVQLVADTDDGVVPIGRKQRTVSASQLLALKQRDQTCRFPGCSRRLQLEAHHIEPWRLGGKTTLDNLVLLCPPHHRLIETRGYIVRRQDGRVSIERPGQSPITVGPPVADSEVPIKFLGEFLDAWAPGPGP